ncbi:hypothetical protein, partial [Ralstonia sp. RL]|uniref:hypothetical protein n=1 Tax=Ralstonia sp. RL TaxID=1839756 RepID=UPI00257D42F5
GQNENAGWNRHFVLYLGGRRDSYHAPKPACFLDYRQYRIHHGRKYGLKTSQCKAFTKRATKCNIDNN